MNRKVLSDRMNTMKPRGMLGWLFSTAFVLGTVAGAAYLASYFVPIPGNGDSTASHAVRSGLEPPEGQAKSAHSAFAIFDQVKAAANSVHHKATQIGQALEDNERLRMENANLRRWAEAIRFECAKDTAEHRTRRMGRELASDTGSPVGRALAAIRYAPPAHLLPSQLYVLAVSYYRGEEFEKAAVILTFLTAMEGDPLYRTAKNLLMAGTAWYRIDNYEMADHYFDEVLKLKKAEDALAYQAQARLWKALVAKRTDRHERTQYWLKELVDHHPKSSEALWINPQNEPDRMPSAADLLRKSEKHSKSKGKTRRKREVRH